MKKRINAAALAAALLCSSCGAAGTPKAPVLYTPSENQAKTSFTAASADFGVELLRKTAAAHPGENHLLSPFSAMTALAMAANGAGEDSLSHYEQLLGGDLSMEEINSIFAGLLNEYRGKVETADAIWFNKGVVPLPDFLKTVKQFYSATVKTADFGSPKTKKEINDWCSKATHGKIPEIATELTPDTTALLLNALYFEMDWLQGFREDGTPGDFTGADGTTSTAHYLERKEDYYLIGDDVQGFLKYYEDPRFCLMALLPDEGLSAADYLENFSGVQFLSLLEGARETEVYVKLPEFTFDKRYSLLPALVEMGLDPGDFSRMYEGGEGDFISSIIQQTHIKLDKKGTTAAAVTEIAVSGSAMISQPQVPEVYLTRPFIFALMDCEQGIPLFLGIVEDPEA